MEETRPRRWEESWDGGKPLLEVLVVIGRETKRNEDPGTERGWRQASSQLCR